MGGKDLRHDDCSNLVAERRPYDAKCFGGGRDDKAIILAVCEPFVQAIRQGLGKPLLFLAVQILPFDGVTRNVRRLVDAPGAVRMKFVIRL
jgi:hypothetical protein